MLAIFECTEDLSLRCFLVGSQSDWAVTHGGELEDWKFDSVFVLSQGSSFKLWNSRGNVTAGAL